MVAVPAGMPGRQLSLSRPGRATGSARDDLVRRRRAPAAPRHRVRSGMTPSAAPPTSSSGASAARKRWPAHTFRVRGGSCVHEKWRHCTISGREGCGTEGERYAPATFLSRWVIRHWRAHPRWGSPAGIAATLRNAPGTVPRILPPLRSFSFTTPLRPSLYEKKERSGGSKSAVERKGRSRRVDAASRGGLPRAPGPLNSAPRCHRAEGLARGGAGGVYESSVAGWSAPTRSRWGGWGSWDGLRRGLSKSATKALHGEVGREKKRGISTILFVHPGSIRAFVADLDNRGRHGPG